MDEKKKHAVSAALVSMAVCTLLLLPATLIAADADRRIGRLESQLAELQAERSKPAAATPAATPGGGSASIGGMVEDTTLFAGPVDRPVAIFYGDVVVDGTLTVVDAITGLGSLVTAQTRDAFYAQDRCYGLPCVNGLQRSLTDCTCVCDTHWSGLACTVHDCYGHGAWIPSTNAMHGYCACTDGYLSEYMCEFTECRGMLAAECADLESSGCSSAAVIGTNCSLECMQPAPCEARANWGAPHYPTAQHPFGLCGAGYQGDTRQLQSGGGGLVARIGGMTCNSMNITECAARFAAEAPRCCSLNYTSDTEIQMADCSLMTSPSPAECAMYADSDTCTSTGCAWCSDRVCMSLDVADITIDCVARNPPEFVVNGTWSYVSYPCTGATCPSSVVARLMNVWTTAESDEDAFSAITGMPWPELSPFPFSGSGSIAVRVTYGATTGWLGTNRYQLQLAPDPQPWFVVYPSDGWSPNAWLLEGTPLQLVTISRGVLDMVCMATTRMDPLVQLQIFGAINEPLAALLPLTADSSSACGTFRLDSGVFFDETGEYGLTIDMQWASNASVAAVEIVPLN
jgi:hypothetical protein